MGPSGRVLSSGDDAVSDRPHGWSHVQPDRPHDFCFVPPEDGGDHLHQGVIAVLERAAGVEECAAEIHTGEVGGQCDHPGEGFCIRTPVDWPWRDEGVVDRGAEHGEKA